MLKMNDTYIVKRFWIQLAGHDDILRKLPFGSCSGAIVFLEESLYRTTP
jgi:hypothetical protein